MPKNKRAKEYFLGYFPWGSNGEQTSTSKEKKTGKNRHHHSKHTYLIKNTPVILS